jgi:hypothetical protein
MMDREKDAASGTNKKAKAEELVDTFNRWGDFVNMNEQIQASSLQIDFVNPEMAALYGKKLEVIKKV